MGNSFRCSVLGLFVVITLLAGEGYADTLEFLTYTPPRGWTAQTSGSTITLRRPNGIGLINLYASYATTASASDEFAKMWRMRVESALPGPAPQPTINREGEYSIALAARQVNTNDGLTAIAFVAFVGRGRALGVLTMATGDEASREVTGFLDSLTIEPVASTVTRPNSGAVAANEIEVDFDVPSGYVSERNGPAIVLRPSAVNDNTPCAYGISPARPSRGSLETDARAAILEALPGWQLKGESYNAMRGTAAAGWPYHWFRADVQSLVDGSFQYLSAMAMAFPAGAGRVNIVWGFGNPARCTLDDTSFARLFHSLRPRGWTSDGGKALVRDLEGTWRNSQSVGLAQYRFMPGARYEFGIGTITRTGI